MRIISGTLKSRRIVAPNNLPVRPTTDFAKESLFNILRHKIDFEETRVLDLFAGIGSISFECCSRGAQSVVAVDSFFKCIDFIKQTAETLNIKQLQAIKGDVFHFITHTTHTFDFIFADPPYDLNGIENLPNLIFEHHLLEKEGLFVLEHSRDYHFNDHPHFLEERHYGKVHFTFFQRLEHQ